MGQALLQLLPLALASALSAVPLTATIFLLLSERGGPSGAAFLGGMVLGTIVAVILAIVAGQALPGRSRQHDALVGKAGSRGRRVSGAAGSCRLRASTSRGEEPRP